MNPPDRRRLQHMLEQIERIERYVAGGRAAFEADDMAQDAVLHCLTVIGEAAGALSEATYGRIASLPPHRPKAQRNVIVHEYWRIDPDLVWATVTRDLPALRLDLEELL